MTETLTKMAFTTQNIIDDLYVILKTYLLLLLLLFFIHSKHEKLLRVHYNRYMKYTYKNRYKST